MNAPPRLARALLLATFAANVVLSLVVWAFGPDRVAIHFNAVGEPDNWASTGVNTLCMLALHAFLLASFLGTAALVRRLPARWINLPHREYWLAPERRESTIARLAAYMDFFGAATFALVFATTLLAAQANQSPPAELPLRPFYTALALYLGVTLAWTLALLHTFRRPTSPS